MKNGHFWISVLLAFGFLSYCTCPNEPEPDPEGLIYIDPTNKFEQIKANLWNNPPNYGNLAVREQIIMELDELLFLEPDVYAEDIFQFYKSKMQLVSDEIDDQVSAGIRIWMMYNHGFIIKTPRTTFAFDLIGGYDRWQMERNYELPENILKSIDVLFISHEHLSHTDETLISKIIGHGGKVIRNVEKGSLSVNRLQVTVHYGVHDVLNRIFEVTTSDGYKVVHTGDNESAEALPYINNVDVLLLYCRTKEEGSNYSSVGMRNCVYKLSPAVMIPGHHYDFSNEIENPFRYQWSFYVDDQWIPSVVQVMTWGEKYDFVK